MVVTFPSEPSNRGSSRRSSSGLGLGLDPEHPVPDQNDRNRWPELRSLIAGRFSERARDEWAQHFATIDACVAPVITMGEAPDHPHHVERQTFVEIEGVRQPSPAPRFSRTEPSTPSPPQPAGSNTDEALGRWGVGQPSWTDCATWVRSGDAPSELAAEIGHDVGESSRCSSPGGIG
jgi:crotonobetainyl-CoA:carnitine CoA-transferase CaiB-like acyl-CoA transferase